MSTTVSKEKQQLSKQKQRTIEALSSQTKTLDYQLMRTIIIATHQLQAGSFLWEARQKLNLKNRNSAWKFCLLLHKLLIDGHVEVFRNAILHIEELKREQGHWLGETAKNIGGVATISLYYQALILKLQFHQTYTILNCDMSLKGPPAWTMDVCFQMLADILDLFDAFLRLGTGLRYEIESEQIQQQTKLKKFSYLTPLSTLLSECTALHGLAGYILNILAKNLAYEDVFGLEFRYEKTTMELQKLCDFLRNLNLPIEWGIIVEDQDRRSESVDCRHSFVQSESVFSATDQRQQFYSPSAPYETDLEC